MASIILAIIALVFALTVYVGSATGVYRFNNASDAFRIGLCTGINRPKEETITMVAGRPFTWQSNFVKVLMQSCSEPYKPAAKDYLKSYIKSWQFYANWAICTLPFLGIAYLLRKHYYAHHRH